jgi:hypothetical protein
MAFIAGPTATAAFACGPAGLQGYRDPLPARDAALPVSTDDWPFLYLHHRKIPFAYWLALACVTGVLLPLAWSTARSLRASRDRPASRGALAALFLLGAAFMLVEVKSIAQLALLFSSTWLTSAAVIAAVLSMALAANMLVSSRRLEPSGWMLIGIVASIGLGYFFTPSAGLAMPLAAQRALGALILALPVFLSGLLFSSVFRRMRAPGLGLAANLCGAFLGCVIENASMAWGIRVLNLAALGLYAAAWLVLRADRAAASR